MKSNVKWENSISSVKILNFYLSVEKTLVGGWRCWYQTKSYFSERKGECIIFAGKVKANENVWGCKFLRSFRLCINTMLVSIVYLFFRFSCDGATLFLISTETTGRYEFMLIHIFKDFEPSIHFLFFFFLIPIYIFFQIWFLFNFFHINFSSWNIFVERTILCIFF